MIRPVKGAGLLFWPVLILGLAADQLFRVEAIGLNVTLWLGGVVAAWILLRWRRGETMTTPERALLVGIVALGCAATWRENPRLIFLDAIALMVSAALLPFAARQPGPLATLRMTLGEAAQAGFQLVIRTLFGAAPVLLDATAVREGKGPAPRIPLAAVARGALLTIPVVLLFGALLGHADPVFGNFLSGLIRFDPDRLASHVLGVCGAGWLTAAGLSGMLEGEPGGQRTAPLGGGFGTVEVSMILGAVDLLFAAFVAFQLPYFFGGAAWVERTAGVTLAEYARHGFFELVVVSALTLPILLLLDARLTEETGRTRRVYRTLAAWQVALVFVIMASAMHRMALYQSHFGLTEDRFFASAFMAGLAVTFAWFSLTVLRGASGRFVVGTVYAWAGWLALLHIVNPERLIVRTNLARAEAGAPLDLSYLGELTSDAVPSLVDGLATMPAAERDTVTKRLLLRADSLPTDWRAWHIGRARAARLIAGIE